MLKRRLLTAMAIAIGVLGLSVPAAEAAVPACPSGSTAKDTRELSGEVSAKTCFKAAGDFFYWKDVYNDGIGAYAYATFYLPGVSDQKYLRSDNYTGQAADTFWNGNGANNIDEGRALKIWACSEDVSTGVDYACGAGTAVAAADR